MTKFHMSSSTSPYEMKRKSRRILFKARAVGLLFVVMWASPASPQVTQDCPLGWNSFRESCYNFVFYPHQPYARAASACLYDSAAIISINSDAEHEFISQWLTRHDLDRSHRWWTSGIGDENNLHWEGDGTASAVDVNKKWGEKGVAQLGNQHIVYKFTTSTNTFLWSRQLFNESSPYICEISVREAFRIHQAARDHTFGTDSSNPDEVPRGPRFTISPQSVIIVDGATTTYLECEAQGVPAPEYSWYKRTEKEQMQITTEMDPRYGLINGKFTFQDPSDSKDAGEYYCKAENPHGAILSNPVRVSFGYLGEFSNDPQGVVAAVLYQGAHMDCSPPRYNPAISVQWYKGPGVNFLRSDLNQHLFLSSNGRLYFSETQQSDAGMYYCIITLSAPVGQIMATAQPPSKTSLGIELVIRGDIATDFGPSIHNDFPVVFPSPPLHGHHLQIECFAYGSLPLYYSWTRDNGPIPHKVTLLQSGRVLLIPDVQLEDAGNYTCHVQNKLKNVDSKTLSLNVEAAPFFIFPLRDQHVDVGSQVSMRCEAMGIPLPRYSWYKNGQPLAPVPGDIDVQMNTVVITRADSRRHSGMYQCSVANVYGTIFSSAELRIVAFAPSFNKRPLDPSKISTLGGNTTIICQPEAAPVPEITWYHNGMDLGVARGVPGRVMMLDNGNLLITQVQMSDQGEYKCTATNDEGSASSSGLLSVVTHTTISVPPVATRVQVNNTGFLSCEASFDKQHHDLVYAWSFNGHPIDTDNDAHFRKVSVEGLHGIYIVNIQFRHDGEYECQAVTVGDTAKATAYVTVLGPPSEPAGLFGQVNNFSILLEWTQGSSRGSPIVSFTTEYITNLNSEWRVLTSGLQTSEASSTQIPGRYVQTVSDLLPGLLYSFRVRAVNQFGIGDASIPSPFYRIPDASPSKAPDRIVQVISSVGTLAFSWNKLDEEHLTGPGVGYRVFWRKQSSDKDSTWQTDTVQGRDNKYITVVGQDNYYLEYEVKVAAFNAFGQGPNSTQVVIMSAEDIPIATPTNIWGEKYNSTAIMVYWDPVVNTRQYMKGKLWGYQINYWGVEEYDAVGGITIYCDDCEGGMVIGLLPYHYYWVNVQTFNSAGYGPQGEKYLVGTFHFSPLLYPEYVTVTSHGASSVYVAWRGVFTGGSEEVLIGYKLKWWSASESILTANETVVFNRQTFGIVEGVQKGIVYALRVLGFNHGGDGKKSPTVYFTLEGQIVFNPQTTEVIGAGSRPTFILSLLFIPFLL